LHDLSDKLYKVKMRISQDTSKQLQSPRRLFFKISALLYLAFLWLACAKSGSEDTQKLPVKKPDTTMAVQKPAAADSNRTVEQMWQDFYTAKDSVNAALNRGDFAAVRDFLKQAAFHALEVSRPDIAAWQLNNIGYYSIVEFKQKTNYDHRMRTIENMRRGPEKIVYLKETKEIFREHLPTLLDAAGYLEEAYELDKDFNDADRSHKIYSNLAFIDWVRNFTLEE